jgi:hypothetical protein
LIDPHTSHDFLRVRSIVLGDFTREGFGKAEPSLDCFEVFLDLGKGNWEVSILAVGFLPLGNIKLIAITSNRGTNEEKGDAYEERVEHD